MGDDVALFLPQDLGKEIDVELGQKLKLYFDLSDDLLDPCCLDVDRFVLIQFTHLNTKTNYSAD